MSKDVMSVQEVSPGYEFVAENPAVPVGYKRTEVGVIPEDWGVASVSEITEQIMDFRGRTPRKLGMTWGGGDIPALSAANVRQGYIDFNVECYFGSHELYDKWMTKGDVRVNDILFTTEAPLGNVALIPDDKKYILSQRTVLLRALPAVADSIYLYQYLLSEIFQRVLLDYSSGSTAKGIQRKKLEQLNVPLPPLNEQSAIATALSDVDALLEELDRLIVKKRDIKQAAMQQLLTGETRLPGFEREWETRQLGEVIDKLDAGVSVNSTADMSVEGRPSVLKTSALENGTLDITETKVIVDKDLTRATLTPKKDTILISRMNTPNLVGETAYVSDDLNWIYLPDRIWMAQFKKSAGVCVKWMSYMLCSPSYRNALREMATGTSGSMKNISKPALLSLRMIFPKQSEQEAIANIISDMDAEIQALEQRRSKTAELKQGMMQELLTGRTRLV